MSNNIAISDRTNAAVTVAAKDISSVLYPKHIISDPYGNEKGAEATYSAAITALIVASAATDIFTIYGAANTKVRILRLGISGTATSATEMNIQVMKRSTAPSGGTSTNPVKVPFDSGDAAASATVNAYTANPTVGTNIGMIRSVKLAVNATATPGKSDVVFDFGKNGKPVTLLSASEGMAVHLNAATVSGAEFNIWVEWTESTV